MTSGLLSRVRAMTSTACWLPGFQPSATLAVAVDLHAADQRVRFALKEREDRMVGQLQVRLARIERRAAASTSSAQRRGQQALAVLVERLVVIAGVDVRAGEDRQAAAALHVGFERFRRAAVQPRHVEQIDRRIAVERFQRGVAQERRRLHLRADARVRALQRAERDLQEIGVLLLVRAVDDQHPLAVGKVDHAPAAVVGLDRVFRQAGFDDVLARLREIDLHAAGDRLARTDLVDQQRRQVVGLALQLRRAGPWPGRRADRTSIAA